MSATGARPRLSAATGGPLAAGGAPPAANRRRTWGVHFEQPEPPGGRLAWLILAAVAALLVAALAVAIGSGAVQRFDLRLLVQLHDRLTGAGVIAGADEAADWVSQWLGPGPHLLPLTLLVSALAVRAGRVRLAIFVPLCFAVGALGESLLKDVVDRTRPNLYPDMAVVNGPSFPSGHAVGAICAVAVPLVVAACLTRRRWLRISLMGVAVLAVLALDLARLVLAVHWPTDVVAGNVLGLGVCATLAAALGVPLPRLAPAAATGAPAGGPRLLAAFWDRVDPHRPASDGVEGNRRLTSLAGMALVPVLTAVALSGVVFGWSPGLHFFTGFAAIPLVLLKLGSTGYRFTGYYLRRDRDYRAAGPPTVVPRVFGAPLVASAVVAFVSGVLLFATGTHRGTVATLHTDSAVIFIVLVLIHVAVHARTGWLASAADLRTPAGATGSGSRRASLIAMSVAGVAVAAGLTFAYPWHV
jgi:membrane-associated phospholipid phosphatase